MIERQILIFSSSTYPLPIQLKFRMSLFFFAVMWARELKDQQSTKISHGSERSTHELPQDTRQASAW